MEFFKDFMFSLSKASIFLSKKPNKASTRPNYLSLDDTGSESFGLISITKLHPPQSTARDNVARASFIKASLTRKTSYLES